MSHAKQILAESSHIYLREVVTDDVTEAYYAWMQDPQVTRYIEARFLPNTREHIIEYVRAMNASPNDIFMAIIVSRDGKHVGNVKIASINWHHHLADISILVGDKTEWGKGYATEAIELASNIAFGKLGLHKLTAGCYESNIGSYKAFLRAGFQEEARLKDHYLLEGHWQDHVCLCKFNRSCTVPH